MVSISRAWYKGGFYSKELAIISERLRNVAVIDEWGI